MNRTRSCAIIPPTLLLLMAVTAWAQPDFEWVDSHDGGAEMADIGVAALTDSQGNLVVVGESSGNLGIVSLLVRKLDRESGLPVWTRHYMHAGGSGAIPMSMIWDGYGNLIIAGHIRNCFG